MQSSSYAPLPEHPNHDPMMKELRSIFDRNEQEGHVFFDYETRVYWGEVQQSLLFERRSPGVLVLRVHR
ncbi:hypothetical protein [Paenibacillus glucanolyticus]|uniref:hypothetical protein n=1 Tax=Paenibacillus glucanolyticus TaxID=59843 RepID=UPI0034CE0473